MRPLAALLTFIIGMAAYAVLNAYRSSPRANLDKAGIQTVSLCDLIAYPDYFKKRLIRTRATLVDYDINRSAYLYDFPCNSWVGVPPISVFDDSQTTRAGHIKTINTFIGTDSSELPRRVDVVIRGELTCLFEREGCTPNLFTIARVEQARALSEDEPWPWEDEKCSQ